MSINNRRRESMAGPPHKTASRYSAMLSSGS